MNREKLFWSKVNKLEDHKCWLWQASTNKDGYGQFWIGDTFIGSHRYAWELTRKCKVPENKMVLHMCDTRSCCNPNHLYCGDIFDNARDREERHPLTPFERSGNLKLHEGEIWLIRKLRKPLWKGVKKTTYQFSQTYIAKMFKVDQSLINLIWKSDKWLSKEGTYA